MLASPSIAATSQSASASSSDLKWVDQPARSSSDSPSTAVWLCGDSQPISAQVTSNSEPWFSLASGMPCTVRHWKLALSSPLNFIFALWLDCLYQRSPHWRSLVPRWMLELIQLGSYLALATDWLEADSQSIHRLEWVSSDCLCGYSCQNLFCLASCLVDFLVSRTYLTL